MPVAIIEHLHTLIEESPKAQVLKLTEAQAREYHEYLAKFSLIPPPTFEQFEEKNVRFLGRKITYAQATQ